MGVLSAAAGILLLLFVTREVFHTLFHPSGHGNMTMAVFRRVWAVAGRLREGSRSLAGPIAMAIILALWVVLSVLGWALIYLPAIPDSFNFASPLDAAEQGGLVDAIYYSWVTEATLGYGDVSPRTGLFRVLSPLQATMGFALFTMAVSWVLSVYPALQRQRAAASFLHALRASGEAGLHPATATRRMERVSEMLNSVSADFLQYPATFYFDPPPGAPRLASELPHAVRMAAAEDLGPEARDAAAELRASLELFAAALGRHHLGMGDEDAEAVLRAYRHHHGVAD